MDQDPNQPDPEVNPNDEGQKGTEGDEEGKTKPEEGVDGQSKGGTQSHQDDSVEIDGVKYPKEEAKELISKGKDYTQKTQTLSDDRKTFEKEQEDAKKAKEDEKTSKMSDADRAQAAADKKHIKDLGFISKQEQDEQRRRDKSDAALNATMDKLEEKYDGKDGRPKFDRKEVRQHALDHGIFKPEAAYRDKYHQKLTDWAIEQAKKTPKGEHPERGAAHGKIPEPGKAPKTFEDAEQRTDAVIKGLNQQE